LQTLSPTEPRKISPFEGFIPFFWLSIIYTSGVLLADIFGFLVWVWITGLVLSLSAWMLACWLPGTMGITHRLRSWTRSDQRFPLVLLAVIFFTGGWRFAAFEPSQTVQNAAYFNDRGTVQITGLVIQPPDIRDSHTNLTLSVNALLPLGETPENFVPEKVSGKVLLQASSSREWAYGDRLQVTGKLSEPNEIGDFSYKDYLANKGIYSIMSYSRVEWVDPGHGKPLRSFIYKLRQNSFDTLHVIFPSPEADLLSGILLGRDQGMSRELQNAFQVTGMTHIIAISGFNITILAGLFSNVFTRLLGHRSGAFAAVIAISCYTLMVGADAAVVRAAIIGTLGVLGSLFGRRQNGLNSLGLAVLAMLFFDPRILWDIGFQLSVAATLGLILYTQPMESWFVRTASKWISEEKAQAWVGSISEIFLITLAAQLMTLPIMAYHFGEVSWLALIANPLVLPPQSLVMVLGGLALLAGLAIPGLGVFMAMVALPFTRYTTRMVSLISQFPGAEFRLPKFNVLWLGIFYALLFFLTVVPVDKRKRIISKVFSPGTVLLFLTGAVFFVWNIVLTQPDGNLHISLIDTEGTILIQTPDGKTLVIGGGSSPSHLNQVLGEMLPSGKKRLDALVIASTAREDINALTGSIDKYVPGKVFSTIAPDANQTTRTVFTKLEDQNVPITNIQVGQRLNLGTGIAIEFLAVEDRGAVLWLTWDNFSALIPAGKVATTNLYPPFGPNVFLLPDTVKAEEVSLEVFNRWSPSVILLPLAESDLPFQGQHELLVLLEDYPVISTLDYSWVRITTDGEKLWVVGD
jgi:competence protein ComEC